VFYSFIADKQHASNTVGTSKQNSTSIASNSVVSNAVALPAKRGRRRGNSKKALSSLAYTSGQMEAGGSPAIMAVASQAIVATKQVTLVMRLTASKLFYSGLLIEDNVNHVMS